MNRAVIVAARRSPIGKYLGSLSALSATDIGVRVARSLLQETRATGAVEEALIGCVLQAGLGQNPARQVALGAGIGEQVSAMTLNKVCGSGLESVIQADRAIRCGDLQVALAGGIESMSRAPYFVRGARAGLKFGNTHFLDGMLHDGLTCVFEKWAMGCAAEHTARQHGITRHMQDAYAVNSHFKATRAQQQHLFDREVVPIETRDGVFSIDETVRPGASIEQVSKLGPAFEQNGTVTPANSSALADGAAMVLVASTAAAKAHGWTPRAEILATATSGVAPKDLFIAPVSAIRQVVEKAQLTLQEIDLFEINEAFAGQMLANLKMLELPDDQVNVHGGAIALGHPIGASGARVLVTLLHAMEHRGARHGVAALCLGGGNAVALCIRRN